MANELQYFADPTLDSGLTVDAKVYNSAGTQVGADVVCTEVGTLAIYRGNMPATGAGIYSVRFFSGGTIFEAQGLIEWDGTAEITNSTLGAEVAALKDFDPAVDLVQNANVTQISGDAVAADNLEAMYDGTGYTAGTAPSSRTQVAAVSAIGGGAFNVPATASNTAAAIKGVTFVGTQTNSFTDTETLNGVYHTITHSANAFDIVYSLDIGLVAQGTEVGIQARLNGSNDTAIVQAYNFVSSVWDTIGNIQGSNQTAITANSYPILIRNTGTAGADQGKILIRIKNGVGTTSPILSIDRLIAAAIYSTISANVTQISGDTLAADNLEAMYDGTGYTDVNAPASRSQLTSHDANSVAAHNNLSGFILNVDSDIGALSSLMTAEFNIIEAGQNTTRNHVTTEVDAVQADIAALNNLSAAQVQAELVTYDAVVPADLTGLDTNSIQNLIEADQVKVGSTINYYLKGSGQTTLLLSQTVSGTSACADEDVSIIGS